MHKSLRYAFYGLLGLLGFFVIWAAIDHNNVTSARNDKLSEQTVEGRWPDATGVYVFTPNGHPNVTCVWVEAFNKGGLDCFKNESI